MKQHTKRRLLHTSAVVASGLVAAHVARDLAAYEVPIPLLAVSSLALFCVLHQVTGDLVARFTRTQFACPDCDFAVVLNGADAGNTAWWRETAAAHPGHGMSR